MRSNQTLPLLALVLAVPLFAAALVALPHLSRRSAPEGLIYSTESRYQNLYLTRDADVLTLRAGSLNTRSSALDLREPYRHVLEYTKLMMLGLGYVEQPGEVLILGLGGGTLTRYLRHYYPQARITNVEIDPAVLAIAQEHFGLPTDSRTQVVIEDARRFLTRTSETYDLIFLDAYHGDYIPFHLLTREFLVLAREHLKEGGAVVANTWSDQQLYERESATYSAVFGSFHSYLGKQASNRIIVATRHETAVAHPELQRRMTAVQERKAFAEIDLPALLNDHADRELTWPEGTPLLVDDHAPVNYLVGASRR